MKVTFKHTFSGEDLSDLFVGAFEGGSNYWIHEVNSIQGQTNPKERVVFWGHPCYFEGPFEIELTHDEDGGEGEGTQRTIITNASVVHGLDTLFTKYPILMGYVLSKEYDSTVADAFLQCVVFGDVIFG